MKSFQAKSRKEWRDWLKKNHANEKEIWLVYYKNIQANRQLSTWILLKKQFVLVG